MGICSFFIICFDSEARKRCILIGTVRWSTPLINLNSDSNYRRRPGAPFFHPGLASGFRLGVGALVGQCVGQFEGDELGEDVGEELGETDGEALGAAEGAAVGARVGLLNPPKSAAGLLVGHPVGFEVQPGLLGEDGLGTADGTEGDPVGDPTLIGDWDGAVDGDLDGDFDGDSVSVFVSKLAPH